jgi:XTP/dITP diphosphohydrolase
LQQVTFVSTNKNKFLEAQAILAPLGISVEFVKLALLEIQSDSLEEIAKEKARDAFARVGRPVIIEDDGLFIHSLNGFPGQYSSFVFKTIGNEGILKLLDKSDKRSAEFRSLIVYFDGRVMSVSEGRVPGKIADAVSDGGWGYDPIFIPEGSSLTFAQLKDQKNKFSHRKKGLEAFAKWLRSQPDFK